MKNETVSKIFKSKRIIFALAAAALLGVVLMFVGNAEKKTGTKDEISEYEALTENKIEQTVEAMCGGKVYVIVTAEYGRETQYAKNKTEQSEQTVLSSGSPVVVRTAAPVIRGITVVCRNGGDPTVCRRITEALSTAYGVSSAKIYVTSLK
ncbi:MAG: hypothetical protein IKH51_06960 [Clostridia bacterium]|nr:hypothetical protein [Clostridia bacterium]